MALLTIDSAENHPMLSGLRGTPQWRIAPGLHRRGITTG